MIKSSNSIALIERFLSDVLSGAQIKLQEQIRAHCDDYAKTISDQLYLEAVKQVNGLRVDITQAIGEPSLEFKITVEKSIDKK